MFFSTLMTAPNWRKNGLLTYGRRICRGAAPIHDNAAGAAEADVAAVKAMWLLPLCLFHEEIAEQGAALEPVIPVCVQPESSTNRGAAEPRHVGWMEFPAVDN